MNALADRVEALARDVGRLRLHDVPGWVIDRLVGHVEVISNMTAPTTSELQHACVLIANDDDLAAEEALRMVDERADRLRRLMRQEAMQ